MKKEIDDSETDYYRDNALNGEEGDEFEHKHYVSVLKDILLKSQTPINVGLYGKWGVGKSSIVHMLDEAIKNEDELKDFEYVEVDAWGISGNSLQQGILEEINAKLGFPFKQETLEDKLYNVRQVDSLEIGKLLRNYGWIWIVIGALSIPAIIHARADIFSALSVIGFVSIVATLIPLSRLFFSTSKRIIPRAVSTFQFNKIYEEIIKKRKKKLVVVIDNLDRCEDTAAVELLGIIQTFMVKENCINILACDDEAIVTHLKNVKNNYTDKDGNEFLSKFFQVTIRIPPFIGENLSSYTEKLIKKRSVPFSPFVKPILISGAIENPRKINQFLNIAVALYRLAEFKEKAGKIKKDSITGNTNFLMKMIVIRHEWPEFYKALETSASLLDSIEDRTVWYEEQISGKIISKEEIDRLKKFLNGTKSSYALDITPFLKLNQESYNTESGIGEFEDAFITLDPKAIEIFQDLEDEKQEIFLNKISDLMKEYEHESEKLTLVNCALSLIDILPKIPNTELRVTALATLGQYMSSDLLEHLDKFNIDQLGLFRIIEDMIEPFSKSIYNKLISQTFDKKQVNEDMLEKFFKNGHIVSTEIMDKIDSKLSSKMLADDYVNTEFILKCIKNYEWSKNNISKPSKIIEYVLANIDFSETPENITHSEFYEKIKDYLAIEEITRFYENMQLKIKEYDERKNALPPGLLAYLNNTPIESFDSSSHEKQRIFVALCNIIANNPDLAQNKEILNIVIPLYEKTKEISEQIVALEECIGDAFVNYVKRADANMIKELFSESSTYDEFLKKEKTITALIEKYQELGSNMSEIIRFLLKTTSYSIKNIVKVKSEEMILSRDEPTFQTLVITAKENDPEFNTDLVQNIGQICLKEAEDDENPNRYSMYTHAIELKLGSYDKSKISKYGIKLIKDQEHSIQDQGFSLLRKFNSTITGRIELAETNEAIQIAIDLIEKNDPRSVQFLGFIFEFKDKFGFTQRNNIIELFRRSLVSDTSEVIMNNITEYIKQSSEEIINNIINELVDFAIKTGFDNAKEQCKQIFINNKNKLSDRRKEDVEKIFGAGILG